MGGGGQVRDTKFGMNILTKNYLMLQNVRFTAFTISEFLRENQQDRGISPTTNIRVKEVNFDEIKISRE